MVATYRIQGRLGDIPNPIVFGGESKLPRPRPEGLEAAAARKDMYSLPFARLQKINDDFAQMCKARLLARVHFGPTAAGPFDASSGVPRDRGGRTYVGGYRRGELSESRPGAGSELSIRITSVTVPSYDRAVHALRSWLDSWARIGRVAAGMHRSGVTICS